jgi:peptidoglycan/LPS O-acetylase OafA/YrhL
VNTSPEPASNVLVSTGEDVAVAGVVSLAFLNPWLAATIAAIILIAGAFLVMFVVKKLRRLRRRYDEWGERQGLTPARDGGRGPGRGNETKPLPEWRGDETQRLPERRP